MRICRFQALPHVGAMPFQSDACLRNISSSSSEDDAWVLQYEVPLLLVYVFATRRHHAYMQVSGSLPCRRFSFPKLTWYELRMLMLACETLAPVVPKTTPESYNEGASVFCEVLT